MKSKTLLNLIALTAALAVSGTACRHTPVNNRRISGTESPQNPPTTGPENAQPIGNGNNVGGVGNGTTVMPTPIGGGDLTGNLKDWIAHPDILQDDTIHFDYDKSAIKSSEESKLAAVVDYLKGHADVAVRVEGNCDERGTDEYNRALGERRALAARERIAQAGIDPKRVDIISYGKDKPVDTGRTDAAHAHNRRDDFVVLTAPGR